MVAKMTAPAAPRELAIDLSKVTAREMNSFFKAAENRDVEALSVFFTRVVTACPYGDPTQPETFLDLPFFGAFQDVLVAVGETAKKLQAP